MTPNPTKNVCCASCSSYSSALDGTRVPTCINDGCPSCHSIPKDSWVAEFVAFIQPFKNRAYTQDTADEIEKRASALLTAHNKQIREMVGELKRRANEEYQANAYFNGYTALGAYECALHDLLSLLEE